MDIDKYYESNIPKMVKDNPLIYLIEVCLIDDYDRTYVNKSDGKLFIDMTV